MAKLTKDELIKKVSEKITDTDLQLELMEDIADSFTDGDFVDKADLDRALQEVASWKEKYRSRFLEAKNIEEVIEEAKEENPEVTEEEVIDIQEI